MNVFTNPEYKFLFALAPEQYRKAVLGWLIRERGLFVGDKKKDGSFTRKILAKKLSHGDGHWSKQVAKTFKGYILGEKSAQGMTLRMGVNLSGTSKFAQSIAKMEDGYTQSTNKNMLVPFDVTSPRKLALVKFKEMFAEKKLGIIRSAGRIFYYDRAGGEIMFMSTKRITVPDQFDFIPAWESRLPSVVERGQKGIDKATEKISNGKL
jgi:hypothetical protein